MLDIREININDNFSWSGLINKSNTASFFQTKDWLNLWIKHFNGEVKILGAFDEDNLIGIAPLQIKEGLISFLGVSPVLGGEYVSDFGDIIAKISYEEIVWEKILAKLLPAQTGKTPRPRRGEAEGGQNSNVKSIEFNFIREDSSSFKILQELGGKVEEVDVAPYADLPMSWEDYLASLDPKDRHELKRKIRKAESSGATLIHSTGDTIDIGQFFQLMKLGSEQKRNFLTREMKAFFGDIFAIFGHRKQLGLSFLKLEDRYVAAALYFLFKDEILLYNSGFNREFSYLSPGLVLKAYLIKKAIVERKSRFDFLRGGERYKYDLGGRERKLYKITFNNRILTDL